MLSIAKVTNTAQASNYYNSPDKYYDKDNADIGSKWGGKAAEILGLSGEVSPEDFIRMLEGRINPDTHLGRVAKGGELEHVPGWDFTFSAPKSLSILALVGGDKRLIDAHIKATEDAMKYIEANQARTRIKTDNKTEYESVRNLVYASYVHTESRKHDPQLHSHNVVMNAVIDNNGQWRSLETLKMYEGKMMSGLVYRSRLAQLVKDIGYEIEITDREKAFFDIKGLPESLLGDMSKRRKLIKETAEQRGLFDAESMAKVTLYTRETKTHVDTQELHKIWEKTVEDSGVDLNAIIAASVEHQNQRAVIEDSKVPPTGKDEHVYPKNSDLIKQDPQKQSSGEIEEITKEYSETHDSVSSFTPPRNNTFEATSRGIDSIEQSVGSGVDAENLLNDVRLAYRVLASDEAVFDASELVKEALKLTLGQAGMEDIDMIVRAMIDTGELLPRSSRTDIGALAFTTPEAFEKEKAMIGLMMRGKDERQAVGDEQGIREFITSFEAAKTQESGNEFSFSSDQRTSLIEAATSRDLVSGIQGFAGTGKTTLLECFIGYANSQGFAVKGFAPTGSATETLGKETGIEARTVDSFLYTRRKDTVSLREVWLVDEASLVGASNMYAMLDEANRSGAAMLLLGDKKQMESVDWGRPFTVLQGFKMQTSNVTNIIRQKNEDLREAVYASINGDFGLAFDKIKNNVFNLEHHSIAADYLKLSRQERENTLVVIPDNEGRMEFNNHVHEKRIEEGSLSANELAVKSLISRNLNEAERTDSRYYENGDVIEFQRDHGAFKAGEFGVVSYIDGKNLMVKTSSGQIQAFNPSELIKGAKFAIDVFSKEEMLFSEGEKIVFTKSRKSLGVKNGDEYTLSNIDSGANTFTLVNDEGKDITLKSDAMHNLSHMYALTSYKAQGKTVDRVMVLLESWRRNLVNERSFYVSLSRARVEARMYVDDVDKVKKSLAEHEANKTTSLTGFSIGDMKRAAEQFSNETVDSKQLFSDLNLAVQKLSHRQGVFSHTALLTETLKSTLGTYDVRDIEKAIYLQRSNGDIGLSYVNHDKPHSENFYTLPSNIRHEAQIVKHMLQGKDRLAPIAGKSVIRRYLEAHQDKVAEGNAEPVTENMKTALLSLLSTRDETVLITGSDHSGHRDVMRTLGNDIAKNSGYKVRGFSTSAEGVRQLKETIKSSLNIYYHLEQMEKRVASAQRLPNSRELWVVENVSQLGAEDLLRLQQVARYAGARMVLVADRQENSLSWGNVPTLLAEQGINLVQFDHSTAAVNPNINDATDKLSQGKVQEALEVISPMIGEIRDEHDAGNDKKVRLSVLAESYINLSLSDREKTAIVVPDYFSRNKVDVQIRKGLQEQGVLKGEGIKTNLYRNANLDPFQKKDASSYRVGQVLQFESNRPGIEKGAYYQVESINKLSNELELISMASGSRLIFNADVIAGSRNNSVQVFHVENKQLQEGEKVRFTRSTPAEKLANSDGKSVPSKTNGVIESINGTLITVNLSSGRKVTVDTEHWKHIEWGYTQNLYSVKDKRFENVLTIMESWKKHFSSQETLHNALTKTSINLKIITDDKAKLLDSLKNNHGFRRTALHDKQVSIDKRELASFDKQFGMGLSLASRSMLRVESAVDKAIGVTKMALVEKSKTIVEKVQQVTRQRTL
ncbi:conjugative relaxase [Pectobacterium carotovorum subsp. carotovorum]|nr:MobF family relaxase [Pectobacterium carotovorum]MCL6336268.1 conjugative relaxase [Pectobacterium carotovorum subsp. carotovorum]